MSEITEETNERIGKSNFDLTDKKEIEKLAEELYPIPKGTLTLKGTVQLERDAFIAGIEYQKAMEVKEKNLTGLHPEEYCHICFSENISWYSDNQLFNSVNGNGNGIMCPKCFLKMAKDKGIELIFKPELVNKAMEAQKWIECKDRLPELGVEVLVFRPSSHKWGDKEVTIDYLVESQRYDPDEILHSWSRVWNCTHWQPLPSPPKV